MSCFVFVFLCVRKSIRKKGSKNEKDEIQKMPRKMVLLGWWEKGWILPKMDFLEKRDNTNCFDDFEKRDFLCTNCFCFGHFLDVGVFKNKKHYTNR